MYNKKCSLERRIKMYKIKLKRTDYKAIKYAEGEITYAEYSPILIQRRLWRSEINVLEAKLSALVNDSGI